MESYLYIAGLHMTSRRPCWWSRTKAFLSSGNSTLFSFKFFEQNFYCIDPQHGRLITWLQTKNWYMSIVNAHFSVNQIMSPPIFCTWKLVKHLDCFGENRRTKDIHHPRAHNFANAQQCPTIQTDLGIDWVQCYRRLHLSVDTRQIKNVLKGCQTCDVLLPNI